MECSNGIQRIQCATQWKSLRTSCGQKKQISRTTTSHWPKRPHESSYLWQRRMHHASKKRVGQPRKKCILEAMRSLLNTYVQPYLDDSDTEFDEYNLQHINWHEGNHERDHSPYISTHNMYTYIHNHNSSNWVMINPILSAGDYQPADPLGRDPKAGARSRTNGCGA